jgi:Capsule assembly protein Wzi/PAP2 superfamily
VTNLQSSSFCRFNLWVSVLMLGVLVVPALEAQDKSTSVAPSVQPGATSPDHRQDRSGNLSNVEGAQESDRNSVLQPGEDPENRLVSPFLKHMVRDQEHFWTTPAHLRTRDLKWIVPVAGVTAGLIASDSWFSKQIPNKPNQLSRSLSISNDTAYSLVGIGGAAFLLGHIKSNDHMKETGLLAAEAALNATAATYAFKYATGRERPYTGNGNGNFFHAGKDSFPSEHAAIAWSIASVVAHEYPGPLSQFLSYGLATAVTLTRVTAQQHFPSDVVVGGLLGWYFGHQVYRAHHDPELAGTAWGEVFEDKGETPRNPKNMGSPYVPLDSWIYPAIERLAAFGYVQSDYVGMRPWTRLACARMLEEVQDRLADEDQSGEAGKIYGALQAEFSLETSRLGGEANLGARVDSVYTRVTGISGTPLRDGYHFGQTIVNDYGRPYWTGFNNVSGVTAEAEAGPLAITFQGEYQHSPAAPSESPQTLAAIKTVDFWPPLANGIGALNRLQLLDSTASVTWDNVEFSFGNQSQWMGPSESGSFLMSDNAPPFATFKIDSVSPYRIPLLSHFLGPIRTEFFVGQLSGHHWEACIVSSCVSYPGAPGIPSSPGIVGPNIVPQPFIHGEKISFKPTANLEIGMGITALFGGPGLPVTWRNFLRTYYAHSSTAADNPGKRTSAADFTYRMRFRRSDQRGPT